MFDRRVKEVADEPRFVQPVSWLRCLRGVDTTTAMTVIAELHDFRRFTSAPQLMSYLGMTPSEYSSGDKARRGSITKAGNSHVRRVLVEAAWSYRHRAAVSVALRKRREGQPPPGRSTAGSSSPSPRPVLVPRAVPTPKQGDVPR